MYFARMASQRTSSRIMGHSSSLRHGRTTKLTWSNCQSVFRLPPSVERAVGEEDSGSLALPEKILSLEPTQLKPFLPWAEYAQNSLRQTTTGLTPVQCILGYQPLVSLVRWAIQRSSYPSLVSVHIHLQRAVWRQKSQADARRTVTPQYYPGQKVWLSTMDICLSLPDDEVAY